MPLVTLHKLDGPVTIREEATSVGIRRVLAIRTDDHTTYEIWMDALGAAAVARQLSPAGAQLHAVPGPPVPPPSEAS